jgi:hypothetical protein
MIIRRPPGFGKSGSRKLVTGSWKLETGCWILETGCWILEAGHRWLDAGYWKLVTEDRELEIPPSGGPGVSSF